MQMPRNISLYKLCFSVVFPFYIRWKERFLDSVKWYPAWWCRWQEHCWCRRWNRREYENVDDMNGIHDGDNVSVSVLASVETWELPSFREQKWFLCLPDGGERNANNAGTKGMWLQTRLWWLQFQTSTSKREEEEKRSIAKGNVLNLTCLKNEINFHSETVLQKSDMVMRSVPDTALYVTTSCLTSWLFILFLLKNIIHTRYSKSNF